MPTITPIPPSPRRSRRRDISTALERQLARYAALVHDAARRYGLAESDIDEVVQDVRIRLWRALSTGERIAVTPASYVYRTAVSAALDMIRRRQARREDALESCSSRRLATTLRPDQVVELDDLATRLARALAALPESRRVVVRLHLLGYHRNEIAEQLGWTEAKTRNLLYRGLEDIRSKLS
ncbi:MAG: sigma-70 family RNA polymerase sigma factor [Gemmatimonadetes bacterium]|uniref:Sigma-70 family RNA polymerase sigma factor n=1 Tax=Candidatus Kutchimonas denitrificans TaxID=3056748 RepID=A0AAE5CCF0_9BACT|nr:sigma-70 family RNA polymerase sigma factor [Gemmatimonadota bacterium]NIR75828.1 sigma-70 family RNA polymerase sigma factor [Candidatus Kutchimonas denitrificans]NIS01995.1 sigma-70 family RNA polymerase sigma factor [Gemmatimonadota bacterium]NIT67799.1 sigma-70 family RNA polymerase sigma factor [Gemmatimonadota bacterium]NIU53786.1 sigma-70 family RNA polymerase sigma factor [Gemmatimonadota bacterium]